MAAVKKKGRRKPRTQQERAMEIAKPMLDAIRATKKRIKAKRAGKEG